MDVLLQIAGLCALSLFGAWRLVPPLTGSMPRKVNAQNLSAFRTDDFGKGLRLLLVPHLPM